jgi:multicomponent Na+:H+ antiporter subunit G
MMEWISGSLFLAGATFALLASVGLLRMPDVFTRMQSATKASTLGLACLLAGLAVEFPDIPTVVRAGIIGAFTMLTSPVAAHVIARAAAVTGAPLWEGTRIDERSRARATKRESGRPGSGGDAQGSRP